MNYTPRSGSRSERAKTAKRRKRSRLLTINLTLLALILAGAAMLYRREQTAQENRAEAAALTAAAETEAAAQASGQSPADETSPSAPAGPSAAAQADEEQPAAEASAGEEGPSGAAQPDGQSPAAGEAGAAPEGGGAADSAEANPPQSAAGAVGAAAPAAAGSAAEQEPSGAAQPDGQSPAEEEAGNAPEGGEAADSAEANPSSSEAAAGDPLKSSAPASSGKAADNSAAPAAGGKSADSSAVVRMNFAGDVIFSGKVQSLLEQKGYDYPYAYVKERFKTDDLTVINLETPVTALNTTGANKSFVFKSPPAALGPLKNAGIDVVNLANNHTLDQGADALLDTIANLDKNGLGHVGAGKDADAAYAPVYVERQGVRIAVVGVSRVLPETSWAAGPNHPGAASAYDPAAAARAVKAAKENADVVVAVVHWGKERVDTPDANQTTLAHTMIDAGADLIIGGHAHVLQGFEQYKGKWIAYGTGNFIFTRSATAKTWETGVFQAECTKSGDCSLTLSPYWAELGQPVPMEAADAQKLLKRIESLSPGVKIGSDGRVSAAN
ncbi:CapA family protein [Saccharibacillus sp. CPCC 101409]|uniref:CapA family protein n=1 Tax=Saccharibacillus sp. CPCC 101409 TaxID=3058041 RepID=UPI002671E4A8|nr:CapA family protein [Saccharibacillus sp. CPCC 101409]MDO3408972.1 CapA family protein [Saccharibacillus sp. CPCC 101409]